MASRRLSAPFLPTLHLWGVRLVRSLGFAMVVVSRAAPSKARRAIGGCRPSVGEAVLNGKSPTEWVFYNILQSVANLGLILLTLTLK
ncbi:protein of unknown function [uncultured Sphingopyxis sp.]|uniref:Uncharacterized protein n=1 Tax=uncultured Sphingopyxis sp. TaxID=310581 RepID=A0A1Y5PYG8_9SPHN|nr:protein of unknown function [uncultured Sphingopyxis sp.]